MVKFVFCAKRKAGMTRQEFQDHWRNRHGPLFTKLLKEFGAHRYVQCHTLDTPLHAAIREARGTAEEFDGIAEVWWESEQQFLAAVTAPRSQQWLSELQEDEANFIDLAASRSFFTVEHQLL
jgi:uncharacterized protein (TIGR02118 family)